MRVLICGDRDWTRGKVIMDYVAGLSPGTVVIHGAARGADSLAGFYAEKCELTVEAYPARWDEFGRAARVLRNQQMLDEGKPDLVVYFHDSLADSRGTANMVRRAHRAGILVQRGGMKDG